ncbi:MAG: V-type ATPase 116kDa subunit family protein [Pelolinea sp.]|nr:V-type ATPase 116kDa subunit family protein [Pelolinea sp.]
MIEKMARVEIIGLKKHLSRLIPLLHTSGYLQIDDIREMPDVMLQQFSPTAQMKEDREEVDLLIANINGLIESFSLNQKGQIETEPETKNEEDSVYSIKENVADITAQVQYINMRKKTLQDELISHSKYIEILKIISPFIPESSKDSGNATIRALVHSSQTRTMALLANQLKLLTHGKFEMITAKVGDETNAIIGIFPLELVSQVEGFMKNEKVGQLVLPEEYAYLSTEEALQHIEKKVELNHEELKKNDESMSRLAKKWLPSLKLWQLICKDKVDEIEVYLKIGETDFTFTIFGWVPSDDIQMLEIILKKEFSEEISLNVIGVPKELKSLIPVKLKNLEIVEPFEHFVKMRATPNYSDIDPSVLVAIFMPIFFGMMAGDVGYGIVMLLIAFLINKKVKEGLLSDIVKFLRLGAIWTIVFGILFGEYFGNLGEKLGIPPLWMSRSEPDSIFPLITMAIAVGVSHILLGLLIGSWNAFIHKNNNHLLERVGMFVGLVGLLFLVGSLTNYLPDAFRIIGWAVLAIGLIALAVSLGKSGVFLGPIEFVGLIGSILSYLRIAALGLASVFLAKVANDIGGMIPSVVAGLLISVLIHALNIVMGILSPTIQSLRLQYVEFFQRFYTGGQSPYEPFKKRVSKKLKI